MHGRVETELLRTMKTPNRYYKSNFELLTLWQGRIPRKRYEPISYSWTENTQDKKLGSALVLLFLRTLRASLLFARHLRYLISSVRCTPILTRVDLTSFFRSTSAIATPTLNLVSRDQRKVVYRFVLGWGEHKGPQRHLRTLIVYEHLPGNPSRLAQPCALDVSEPAQLQTLRLRISLDEYERHRRLCYKVSWCLSVTVLVHGFTIFGLQHHFMILCHDYQALPAFLRRPILCQRLLRS